MISTVKAKYKAIFQNITGRAVLACGLCSLAALGFGYDFAWWGSILGAPYFNDFYGEVEVVDPLTGSISHVLSTRQTSAGTGIGTVGLVIGAMSAGYFNERLGRKKSIVFLVAGLGLLGTFLQGISVIPQNYWVCVIGKMVVNASLGSAYAIVPLYMGECSPPEARGAFMAMYSIMVGVGSLISAGVILAVVNKMSLINFVLPIGLQAVIPLFLIAIVPFFTPESPRWLANRGRLDEAVKVLDYLRRETETSHDQHIREVAEMKSSFDRQKQLQTSSGWLELFKGRNLQRTLTVIGTQCLQQAQGASFMNNYLVITFLGLGITNIYVVLIGLYVYVLGISVICLFLPDYLGRRALLLGGSAMMFAGMIVTGAVGGAIDQPSGSLANLIIGFSGGWGSTIWVVNGEVPSRSLAEKSMAVGAASQFSVNVVVTFVTPYLQNPGYGNLGPKVTFIFAGFCVVAFTFVYFTVPETKGKTLEEIDYMFEHGVRVREFGKYDCTGLVAPDDGPIIGDEEAGGGSEKKEEIAHIERLPTRDP